MPNSKAPSVLYSAGETVLCCMYVVLSQSLWWLFEDLMCFSNICRIWEDQLNKKKPDTALYDTI